MDADEFHRLKVKCSSLQSELHESEVLARNLQAQLNDAKGALRAAEHTLEERDDTIVAMRNDLNKLRREHSDLKEQMTMLTETKFNERGSIQLGNSIRYLVPETQDVVIQTELTAEEMELEAGRMRDDIVRLEDEVQRMRALSNRRAGGGNNGNDSDDGEGGSSQGGTPNGLQPRQGGAPAMPMLSLNLAQQRSEAHYGAAEDENNSFCFSTRGQSHEGVTPRMRGFYSSRGPSETRRSEASPGGQEFYRGPMETPRVTMVLPPSQNVANLRGTMVPTMVTGETLITPRVVHAPAMPLAGPLASQPSSVTNRGESVTTGAAAPGSPHSPVDDGPSMHIFTINDAEDGEDCPICDLMDQVKSRYAGKMIDRHAYYAVGWIPEMCSRWQTEHCYTWTIEERAAMANILAKRPTVSSFSISKMEGPLQLWRSRVFWKSPWKPCFALLQGVFLYVFPSREPSAPVLAVTLVRGAQIQSCQADGKDYVMKITSLCCRNCIGGVESDSTEVMTIAFDSPKEMSDWSVALLHAQQTCPHRCSSKFQNEIASFREISECLLEQSTKPKKQQRHADPAP